MMKVYQSRALKYSVRVGSENEALMVLLRRVKLKELTGMGNHRQKIDLTLSKFNRIVVNFRTDICLEPICETNKIKYQMFLTKFSGLQKALLSLLINGSRLI